MAKKDFSEKATFEQSPEFEEEWHMVLRKNIPGRGNSSGKVPETRVQLVCLRKD